MTNKLILGFKIISYNQSYREGGKFLRLNEY
jgi:hypothetical protein